MKFKIYRSSAGSGKTFTLAKEYLKLALLAPGLDPRQFSPQYFRHILAVTFTNDAANEMKERVLKNLTDIAFLAPDASLPLLNMMLAEVAVEYPERTVGREELIERAKAVREAILHQYADFSISTIDSFHSKLVQSFKKELGLPYQFEVTLETAEILKMAVDQLLDQTGGVNDPLVDDILLGFCMTKLDESKSWFLEKDLTEIGKDIFSEDAYAMVQELATWQPARLKAFLDQINQQVFSICNTLSGLGKRALALCGEMGLQPTDFQYGNTGVMNLFKKMANCSPGSLPEINFASRNYQKFAGPDPREGYAKKLPAERQYLLDQVVEELASIFHEAAAFHQQHVQHIPLYLTLRRYMYQMALVSHIDKLVGQIKAERNQVHLAEFNRNINRIVEAEPVPYIYERLGERFNHILIDEFQDTSRMQWHNLIPLMVNGLGKGMVSMVVGDGKQAIYRWRGGKAEMLVDLPAVPTIPEESPLYQETNIFHEQQWVQVLQQNFRSRSQIIAFNNRFFESIRDAFVTHFPLLKNFYAEVAQKDVGKPGGHVSIDFLDLPGNRPKSEAVSQAMQHRVLTLIGEIASEGIYKMADITILVRKNSDGATLANYLLENGVPVVSAESLLLSNAFSVKLLVDILKVIYEPDNPLLKSSLIFELDQYFAQLKGPEATMPLAEDYLELAPVFSAKDLESFILLLKKRYQAGLYMKNLLYLTLYEMVEELVRELRLFEKNTEHVYLHRFLHLCHDFSSRMGNSLQEFLDYWELKKGSISVRIPQQDQAVRIMTVHKSKGLQFPVVIFPYAIGSMKVAPQSTTWVRWEGQGGIAAPPAVVLPLSQSALNGTPFEPVMARESELTFLDEFNLLYVCFTRPEERLYVLTQWKEKISEGQETADLANLLNHYLALDSKMVQHKQTIQAQARDQQGHALDYSVVSATFFQDDQSRATVSPEVGTSEATYFQHLFHTQNRERLSLQRETHTGSESEVSLETLLSARKQGVILHYGFEKVRFLEDIPEACRKLVMEGYISETERQEYQQKMELVLNLPVLKPYYTQSEAIRVGNEKEVLLGATGKILRPDRMVRLGNQLVLIDYKTGQEEKAAHREQLTAYGHAMAGMGYRDILLLLVYTEVPKVVAVPFKAG